MPCLARKAGGAYWNITVANRRWADRSTPVFCQNPFGRHPHDKVVGDNPGRVSRSNTKARWDPSSDGFFLVEPRLDKSRRETPQSGPPFLSLCLSYTQTTFLSSKARRELYTKLLRPLGAGEVYTIKIRSWMCIFPSTSPFF
ncbi:MAG: hypothetical protein UX71_C0002G0133 [Parcubacteria group bacterium GW2011_GWA1_47_10]|nr:MAG: hypothetical protein UX71_C0002G0133 [Parcubacteria group bacterium GW2011_GWA1_47_10]